MNPKMKSAIEKITLNDATFSNEVIEPTYVNFFYGKNGAGKSTIARTFKANDERLQWQAGKASTDYDVLVYDTDFINANLRNYGNLAGVFTVNETNIAIQEQVDTLNAERKKMGEEYNGHKAAIDQKTADKNTALSTFQSDCWSKSAEARTLFDEAIKGKKKAALFAQEILAITPVAHDVEDLKTLYGTVFSGDAQQYNMLSKAGKVTYASLPGYELMGKPISSSSDTDFAKFIKALKATDWVRSGHTHFAGQTDGKCPYCQQKLPSNFDKEIAACFDAQYQDDISAINAFQRTYESEMDSVVATLEGNVSAAMPELDLSEYEVKVQLLVDAITINKQRIAAKIKEPTSIASLEDTDSLLIEIGTLIDGFNKKIKENNEIVRDLKTKKVLCKKQVWEYLAELLKADVAAYNKALSDLDTEIKALKDKMEQLKKDATAKKKEANELNKQIVNTEATIDSINVLLDNSGFEGFHLRAKDGVANTYEVIRPDAFICFSGGYTFSGKKGEPYKTDSVNNFAIRTLIQAVGRICRTGLKNPDIYIYVDNTILTDYDLSIVEQRMLNPEFAELVKVGKTYFNGQANENLDIAVMENRAGTLALKAMQIINELKRNWTEDSIDYWKALRELCLMRPTLSRKNVEQNSQYQLVYMCAPGEITAYSYEQEGDYNKNINIKFDGSLPRKMSEDEVHLKEIMQIPGVKALFEKHGYATSFVPSEFILTPPMFNNIYKGALGEVVGKYILEQYAGVTLQEMPPEFFELFDYTLGNGVYVDFKLWKETMLISAEEEKKNVLEKLDKCGGKRAVIINIMLDHNMQITSSDNGRIIEIPYLYRLDRKEIGTEIIAKINREGYLQ